MKYKLPVPPAVTEWRFLPDRTVPATNPFGGLTVGEEAAAHCVRPETEEIVRLAEGGFRGVIQLLGPHGRGKTSALRYLSRRLDAARMMEPGKESADLKTRHDGPLLLDGIHLLPLRERLRLYRDVPLLILTTHYPRTTAIRLAGRHNRVFRYDAIKISWLRTIILRRLALLSPEPEQLLPTDRTLKELIDYFGHDYRGLMQHLYDEWQRSSRPTQNHLSHASNT